MSNLPSSICGNNSDKRCSKQHLEPSGTAFQMANSVKTLVVDSTYFKKMRADKIR